MTILPDYKIRQLAQVGMIEPWFEGVKRPGKISYGISSYGYDASLAPRIKLFSNLHGAVIDPKAMDERCFHDVEGDSFVIPPNSYALGHTVERFSIPNDVLVICLGKSTYARAGIIVNVTPLEPGWKGHVTLEISNATPLPARVYAHEGICQFVFLRGTLPERTYADRSGTYQGQSGITLPRIAGGAQDADLRAVARVVARDSYCACNSFIGGLTGIGMTDRSA